MLLHDIRIAAKSLKRNRVLSTLTIAGVALGIALSTTFAAVRHAFARNPVSHKEAVLRYVRLDSWDPERAYPSLDDPKSLPTQITYRDMTELMRSKIPIRQTGLFKTSFYVFPEGESARPFQQETRLCFRDFFAMFDVPFRYGSAWDAKADTGGEPVVVLSEEMNDRLFGGANSVGKTLKLADKDFRVVGVLAHYRPNIRIYDMTQNQIVPTEGLFAPFNLVRPMQLRSIGNLDGWGPSPATPGFEGFLQSEAAWIQFWVELPDAAAHAAYAEFLKGYILEQKKHGRFLRPLNYRLSSPSDLIRDFKAVPKEMNALLVVSLLFLAVCSVNLVGLLLGKFLARSNEV
ncbi:MAG TPA: ABC transporter permease, partial [Thermoanaerobaculia bacterium]|nr:ABC transporter permease [Thermoanaerobaculia bacterium]